MAIARPLPRRRAIPLSDSLGFRNAARRHAYVRVLLAAALLSVLTLAFFAAQRLPEPQSGVLPPGRSGVLVLDLSSSINPRENDAIREALRRLSASGDRYGLVLFSDDAYEAMPPGMTAATLSPLMRYYEPVRGDPAKAPLNPWSYDFRGGTRISAGINMALDILKRDRVTKRAIVLISDLFDSSTDATKLQQALIRVQRDGVRMRVVTLAPGSSDAAFFAQVLGKQGQVSSAKALPEPTRRTSPAGARPTWVVAFGVLLVVLLALNELLCGRLAWKGQRA